MSFAHKLETAILRNHSLLFVGLDPNPDLLPDRFRSDPDLITCLKAWLRSVIEQTADLVCAYKPTLGFYQALGAAGLELLQQVLSAIPPRHPGDFGC